MSYVIIAFLVVSFIGFPLLTLIITVREKKYVWIFEKQAQRTESGTSVADSSNPYVPPAVPAAADDALPVSPFASKMAAEFDSLGYMYLGDYRHAKGGIYKIRYDVWISPDSQVLAWTEAGSVSGIPVQNITMTSMCLARDQLGHTSTASPVAIDSFTSESCYDPDLAGSCESMVFPSASATKLESLHRQRLTLIEARSFSDDPMSDFRRLRQEDAEKICESGLGRFIDADESVWLPTWLGGLKMFVKLYAFMLGRRIYPHRMRLKRRIKNASRTSAQADR